jgi:hypothetical protein
MNLPVDLTPARLHSIRNFTEPMLPKKSRRSDSAARGPGEIVNVLA